MASLLLIELCVWSELYQTLFIFSSKYKKILSQYEQKISFQYHHTIIINIQMEQIENTGRTINQASERERIGISPMYISPKNPGGQAMGGEIEESQIRFEAKSQLMENGIYAEDPAKLNLSQTISDKSCFTIDNFNYYAFINVLIYVCYALGSTQPISKPINVFHAFDILGTILAVIFVLGSFIRNLCRIGIIEGFHIYGMIFTLIYYSVDNVEVLPYINGFRCLRLVYLLLIFKQLGQNAEIFKELLLKAYKLIVTLLIIVATFGLIDMFLFHGSQDFRCRPSRVPTQFFWPPTDNLLCGQRQCPSGSYCGNPTQFDIDPPLYQLKNSRVLLNATATFKHNGNSIPTNLMIISLNRWVQIADMIYNAVNPLIATIIFILTVFFSRYILNLVILNFFDFERNQVNFRTQQNNKKQSKRAALLGSYVHKKLSVSIAQIQKQKQTPKEQQKKQSKKQIQQDSKDVQNKTEQKESLFSIENIKLCASKILWNVFYVAQTVLTALWGYSPSQGFNQFTGICIAILFIFWSIYLAYSLFQLISGSISEENRKFLFFQIPVYAFCLADYILRFLLGLNIIEQPSPLTPIATAIITLRYYESIIVINLGGELVEKAKKFIPILEGVLKYLPFLFSAIIVPGFLCLYTDNIKNNENTSYRSLRQINFALSSLSQRSWMDGIEDNALWPLAYFGNLFRSKLFEIIALATDLTFVPFVVGTVIAANVKTIKQLSVKRQAQLEKTRHEKEKKISDLKESEQINIESNLGLKSNVQDNDDTKNQPFLTSPNACFFLGPQNPIRTFVTRVLESQKYKAIYFYYLIIYCVGVFSMKHLIEDQWIERLVYVHFDVIFLVITVLQCISKGVFGKDSYTCNRIPKIVHLILTLFIFFNWVSHLLPELVRVCEFSRVFFLVSQFQQGKKLFDDLGRSFGTIFRYILLMGGILFFFMVLLLIPFGETVPKPDQIPTYEKLKQIIDEITIKDWKVGMIVFASKGWNWGDILVDKKDFVTEFYKFCILITSFIFDMTVGYALTAFLLSDFYSYRFQEDIQKYPQLTLQQIEKKKIADQILKIKAQEDYQAEGLKNYPGFAQLFTNNKFQFGFVVCNFLGFGVTFGMKFNRYPIPRFIVSQINFITFLIELLVFGCEATIFGRKRKYFWIDLFLLILAAPGVFITFVPVHKYSLDAPELANFLYIIVSLMCLRFFRILTRIKFLRDVMDKYKAILTKLNGIFLFFIATALLLSIGLNDIISFWEPKYQTIAYSLNSAFLGIYGGSFYKQIYTNQIPLAVSLLMHFLVTTLIVLFKNFIMTMVIYKLQDSQYSQSAYFNKKIRKFPNEVWKKLDPQGKGFVNFRKILYFSRMILPYFGISRQIAKTYQMRENIFSKLRIPIYQYIQEVQQEQNNDEQQKEQEKTQTRLPYYRKKPNYSDRKRREYVVLLHDVIYYFYRLQDVYDKGNLDELQEPRLKGKLIEDQNIKQFRQKSYKQAPKGIKKTNLNSEELLQAFKKLPKIRKFLWKIQQRIAFPEQVKVAKDDESFAMQRKLLKQKDQ